MRFSAQPSGSSSSSVGSDSESDAGSSSASFRPSISKQKSRQTNVSISPGRMRFRSPETYDSGSESESGASTSSLAPPALPSLSLNTTHRRFVPPEEKKYMDETISAIRLRTRHYDAYDEWERNARLDAFRAARQNHKASIAEQRNAQAQARASHINAMKARHESLVSAVTSRLSELSTQQASLETRLRKAWQAADGQRNQRIERVIKWEEDKLKAKLDGERRAREEVERKQREQAEREAREAEERRKAEEKRKQQEEAKRQAELEAQRKVQEEDSRRQAEEAARKEMSEREKDQRATLGMSSADDDWQFARDTLLNLKAGPMKTVKADKALKSAWSAVRRQITPKVGQLTDDDTSVMRIAKTLHDLILPPSPAPQPPDSVYNALLSSLSKAILLQVETEVTAEKRAARPLARVVGLLLGVLPSPTSSGSAFGGGGGFSSFGGSGFSAFGSSSFGGGGAFGGSQPSQGQASLALPGFPAVFYAKFVQRAGGWPIPISVPQTDIDGVPWGGAGASAGDRNKARARAMGYLATGEEGEGLESTAEHGARVAGLMRLYVTILSLATPTTAQAGVADADVRGRALFAQTRMWTWFARLLGQRGLLDSPVAPQAVHAALDVFGADARAIWGAQWIKVLGLLYTGATAGLPGEGDKPKFLGGDAPEGKAARVRVQLEVERIMGSGR